MNLILTYSGGMDSTVLLYHLIATGNQVRALSVGYGQRHGCELKSAAMNCTALGVEHRIADLRSLFGIIGGSSLTSANVPVPDGHYAEESMKATVVPNRNMILLAVAAGWAMSVKADAVAFAAHSGDHAIYPDCRPEFANAVAYAIKLADWHKVELMRPFIQFTKADIVRRGTELKVPFAQTWSCYKGGEHHCGRCGTCIERREAFYLAGVPDPTSYLPDAPATELLIAHGWKLAS